MAQRRAHPRHQLADVERLVDVVVGAEIERLDLLGFALARRQHDDRHIGPFARAADHVLAVAVGQAEIEQHDVGRFGGDALDRLGDGAGAGHLVVVRLQRGLEKAQDRRLVVDHQHADPCAHAGAPLRGKVSVKRVPRPLATGLSALIDAAMRLHDALGDGKAETGALAAVRARCLHRVAFDELVEDVRQSVRRNAGTVVGHAQRDGIRRVAGIDHDARLGRRVDDRIGDDVADRLLDQGGVGAHQRQIGRQLDLDALLRAVRRAALTTRSTISRRSIQSRRNSSAPASMRVIASRLRTISSRSSASVLIWPSRSFFAAGSSLSP